jgi:hypothetical protein
MLIPGNWMLSVDLISTVYQLIRIGINTFPNGTKIMALSN